MKKLSKIKLNQFSKEELDRRKMNALKGGCACTYAGGCVRGCGSLYTVDGNLALASWAGSGPSDY